MTKQARRIVVAMPGTEAHQREYVAAIERLGLEPYADYCFQANSWINDRFPDALDPAGVDVGEAADRAMRRNGWSPKQHAWAYYDYEPAHRDENGKVLRSWLWQKVLHGFDPHDYAFADLALKQFAAWRDAHLPGAKISFYGVPTSPRNQGVWSILDMPYLTGVARFMRDAEWIPLNLYPREDILAGGIPEGDEAQHREHVVRNYTMLRAVFRDKPVVPMLWPRPGVDNDRYFAVYMDAIGATDADAVMLWSNPTEDRPHLAELEAAAPHLLAWARAGDESPGVIRPENRPSNRGTIGVTREPMWLVQCFAGGPMRGPDNPAGLSPNWNKPAEEAVAWLRNEIVKGYQHGARWFFLNRPMGTDGVGHVSAGSWLTIDAHKRELMADLFRRLANGELGEPVHVVPFIGSGLVSADSLQGWDASYSAGPGGLLGEARNGRMTADSQVTIGGWLSAGVGALAIDNSAASDERHHFLNLHRRLVEAFGVPVMGEAYPTVVGGGIVVLDATLAYTMPWVATLSYMEHPSRAGWFRAADPSRTRLYIWTDQRISLIDVEAAKRWVDKGYILITQHPELYAYSLAAECAREAGA